MPDAMADSSLKSQIADAQKAAMRARERERLATIRLMMSAFKQVEVDERIEIDDTRALAILDKLVKQRRESIKLYEDAGRDDLAAKEKAEIEIIQDFMPTALTEDEINTIVTQAIKDTGATSMKDMGQVMNQVRPQLMGRADMGLVSQLVKKQLG